MQFKYAEIADTVYFWFAANETTGTAGDGATPLYDVRLAGAAAGAAPTTGGTPTLLSHADYSPGLFEIAIDTTGQAAGEYAVFCTLTISTVNPAGFCGSYKLRTAATAIDPILGTVLADTNELQTNQGAWATATGFATPTNITAASGIALSATQAAYAPSKAGDKMDLIDAPNATGISAIVTAINSLATYGLTALNTLLVTTGIKAATVPALVQADVRTAVGLASANLDTQLAGLPTDADVNAACDTAISDAAIVSTLATAHGVGSWLTATGFSTHSAADVAALVLVTPAQKIVTDAAGKVTYSNTAPPTAADVKTAMEADGSKLDHLWETTEDDAGVRRFTVNALELSPAGGGGGATAEAVRIEMDANSTKLAAILASAGGVGTGPVAQTYTITSNGLPCADCLVVMATDAIGSNPIHSGTTDALGQVTFYPDLPAGTTVYLWRFKTGVNFTNPDVESIS